jgi:hypothetical protein
VAEHVWYPGQESNLYLEFRKPSFYPLNYRDEEKARLIALAEGIAARLLPA